MSEHQYYQLQACYLFKGESIEFERCFKRFIATNNSRKALLNRLRDLL
jgi:hypothetical protein